MSELTETLETLAATVTAKASVLAHQIASEGLLPPTLGEASHAGYAGESPQLRQTRYDLARAAKALLLLAQGPEDTATSLSWSSIDSANLEVLTRFNFFAAVPLDTPAGISAASLATTLDLPLDLTTRMIRYGISNGLFAEPRAGFFAHSATSASLARSRELLGVARIATGPLATMTSRLADALQVQQAARQGKPQILPSGDTVALGPEDPAFCLAFPGFSTPWEYAHARPEFATALSTFMQDEAATSRMRIEHLFVARDWAGTGAAKVVDVGGSAGHVCVALASILPEARFLVLDANEAALERGRAMVKEEHGEYVARIEYRKHDFFTAMPADIGGDVYILQWILHDWNDTDAVRILKGLVPGLKSGARVLIIEGVRKEPPVGLASTLDEKMVLYQDMTMLAAHNARERTVSEFVGLFAQADPRFRHVATGGGKDGAYRSVLEFEFGS